MAHAPTHRRPAAPSLQEVDALIAELEAFLATEAAERTTDGEALLERARELLAATAPSTQALLFSRPPKIGRRGR